jgi:ankyrin repeat protein
MKLRPALLSIGIVTSAASLALARDTVATGTHRAMPVVKELRAVSIVLERGECFGTCPTYRVELRGTGEIIYEGRKYVLVEGQHRMTIDPQRVAALVEEFRKSDFWSLRPAYVASITDSPSYRLTLSIDGQARTVTDYVGKAVGMPDFVTALEEAVDKVAGTRRWITGDEETLASLQREKWDFSSRATASMLARAAVEAPDAVVFGLLAKGAPVKGGGSPEPGEEEPPRTALDNACLMARVDLAQRLIALGAATNVPGVPESALRYAAASGHPAIVAEILKLKPDVNARDQRGLSALMWIEQGFRPFHDQPGRTDTVQVIRMLVAAGADPNLKLEKPGTYDAGNTVLHMTNDIDHARAYIDAGAKVNQRNNRGETPVLTSYSEDVVLLLLDKGADPELRSNDGTTLRQFAKQQKWTRVLARLTRG